MNICHWCLIARLLGKTGAYNITVGTTLIVVTLENCADGNHRKVLEAQVLESVS